VIAIGKLLLECRLVDQRTRLEKLLLNPEERVCGPRNETRNQSW